MVSGYRPKLGPHALGTLLAEHRHHRGDDLAVVAARSAGAFTSADLSEIEAGRRELEPEMAQALYAIYGLLPDGDNATRRNLMLDLDQSSIRVGDLIAEFDSSTADDVLRQYLELVRRIRGAPEAAALVLRGDDISALAEGLDEPAGEIRHRLEEFMAALSEPERAAWLDRLARVAGMGIAGTVVALGITVAASNPTAARTVVSVECPSIAAEVEPSALPVGLVSAPAMSSRDEVGGSEAARADGQASAAPEAEGVGASVAEGASASEVEGLADELGPATVLIADPEAIEALIPVDLEGLLPTWTIEHAGPHTYWRGITHSTTHTITIFQRPESSLFETAEILAHEIGHAIDLTYLDDDDRHRWLELRGMPPVWWADEGRADFAVGAGDFAEAVANRLVGSVSASQFGDFTPDQLAFVDEVLARGGQRAAEVRR